MARRIFPIAGWRRHPATRRCQQNPLCWNEKTALSRSTRRRWLAGFCFCLRSARPPVFQTGFAVSCRTQVDKTQRWSPKTGRQAVDAGESPGFGLPAERAQKPGTPPFYVERRIAFWFGTVPGVSARAERRRRPRPVCRGRARRGQHVVGRHLSRRRRGHRPRDVHRPLRGALHRGGHPLTALRAELPARKPEQANGGHSETARKQMLSGFVLPDGSLGKTGIACAFTPAAPLRTQNARLRSEGRARPPARGSGG